MHVSHDLLHITLSAHVAGETQNVQITQHILSASQLRLWAILEFSECRFCSLQSEGPISDSSDISLAITAFLPRSVIYFSLLSLSLAIIH